MASPPQQRSPRPRTPPYFAANEALSLVLIESDTRGRTSGGGGSSSRTARGGSSPQKASRHRDDALMRGLAMPLPPPAIAGQPPLGVKRRPATSGGGRRSPSPPPAAPPAAAPLPIIPASITPAPPKVDDDDDDDLLAGTRTPNTYDQLKHIVRRVNGFISRYEVKTGAGRVVRPGDRGPRAQSVGFNDGEEDIYALKGSLDKLIKTQETAARERKDSLRDALESSLDAESDVRPRTSRTVDAWRSSPVLVHMCPAFILPHLTSAPMYRVNLIRRRAA